MPKPFLLIVILGVLISFPGESFMTYTHEPGMVGIQPGWPEELKKLVQTDALVMCADGPLADVRLYCAGNTEKLNAFLKEYAAIPEVTLRVTLHPGRGTCTYPEGTDTPKKVYDVDWQLWIAEFYSGRYDVEEFSEHLTVVRLDIWLGGQVELKHLVVPASLPLVSSGELEGFVQHHQEQQAAAKGENGGDDPAESAGKE